MNNCMRRDAAWLARTALALLVVTLAFALFASRAMAAPIVTFIDYQGIDGPQWTEASTGVPHITLSKQVSELTYDAGDLLHYTLIATNDGGELLNGVTISDPTLTNLTCTSAQPLTLDPGQSLTCTGDYTTTQADVDAGKVDNAASVTATTSTGRAISGDDSNSAPATRIRLLALAMSAAEANFAAAGDLLHYTLVATNQSNLTLTDVTISDATLGALVCTQPVTLLPGQSLTCTATYTVMPADVTAGKVENTASVAGTLPTGASLTQTDQESVPTTGVPHLTLVKTAAEANYDEPGDVLHYTLVVTNDGNTPLTGVTISDPLLGTLVCTQPVNLEPGQSLTCAGSTTTTQKDVDDGKVENNAIATGTPPNGPPVTNIDKETVPAIQKPHITVVKTVTESMYDAPGAVLHYFVTATNDGNVTLTNVTIEDPLWGSCGTSVPETLIPGQSLSCMGNYTTLQSDVDAGRVDNTACGLGIPPYGPPVTDCDSKSVPGVMNPELTLAKKALTPNFSEVGDIIQYSYYLTNTGNVTLFAPFTVTDDKTVVTCPPLPTTLALGESMTCTASYAVTQADVEAEFVKNIAFAEARGPENENVPSNPVKSNEDTQTVVSPTDPTNLPTGPQPDQPHQSLFLPSLRVED